MQSLDMYYGATNNPLWVLANAGLAGVINFIPGAQGAMRDMSHTVFEEMRNGGATTATLDDFIRRSVAYGWW